MRRGADLAPGRASLIEVLDRVLDKGIVIDGWGRVAVAGIDLIGIEGWVVVASIQTYLQYAESLGLNPRVGVSQPTAESLF
jgi:gas vesicle structural protein